MITVVDRNGEMQAQKVLKPDGTLVRYQYGIPGEPMNKAKTLHEARVGIGKAEPLAKPVVVVKKKKVKA